MSWQLYQTNQTGDWEIFRLNQPGDLRNQNLNLSRGEGTGIDDITPSRSPNGEWVAFASNRDGNWEIYVTNTDGTVSQRITSNTTAIDINPVWGPNNYIVYESSRDGNWELYMVDVLTGIETRLTDDPASDLHPSWSPDGARIAFQSNRTGIWQIHTLDLATGETTLLSDGTRNDQEPLFSPSGNHILFRSSLRSIATDMLYLMVADGSDQRAITDQRGNSSHAAWSSDGGLIAYQSDLDGDLDIYVYELSARSTRQMTDNTVADYAPMWLCDQPMLVFNSDITGDPNLFQAFALPMNAPPLQVDQQAQQLTFDPSDDLFSSNGSVSSQYELVGVAKEHADSLSINVETSEEKSRPAFPIISITSDTPDPTTEREQEWEPINACVSVCSDSLIYQTNMTGDWEVFLLTNLSSLGHALINVSQGYGNEVDDVAPSRSPDGNWVAFTSNRDGDWDIYVANVNDPALASPRRLTNSEGADVAPVWSPNSQYLAYRSNRDGNWEIYKLDIVTGIETRLTFNPANDSYPNWSPDSSKLVFQSDRTGIWQIYVHDMKSGSKTLVTEGVDGAQYPKFSPDGQHIVFQAATEAASNPAIYVVGVDGSDLRAVSNPPGNASNPVWSKDGLFIAYQSDLDGDLDIYLYDVMEKRTRQLTDNLSDDYAPNWHCSQSTLIFNSDVSGDPNLYQVAILPIDAPPIIIEADLANQLTFNSADDLYAESSGSNEGDWNFNERTAG